MTKKNSQNKAKNSTSTNNRVKITPERKPFIFQRIAEGKPYEQTAQEFNKEFKTKITLHAIYNFLHRHPDEYKEFLDDIRQVRLANAKARILDIQGLADKMRKKIEGEIDSMTPKLWAGANMDANLRELRGLYEQIAKDSGDRTDKGGDGQKPSQIIQIINNIPDTLADNVKSSKNSRFKVNGL